MSMTFVNFLELMTMLSIYFLEQSILFKIHTEILRGEMARCLGFAWHYSSSRDEGIVRTRLAMY